jgi:hypothetical protein
MNKSCKGISVVNSSEFHHFVTTNLHIFSKKYFVVIYNMAIRVVEFSNRGYKIRKIFA